MIVRDATCRQCGRQFEQHVVLLDGRELATGQECEPCIAAREARDSERRRQVAAESAAKARAARREAAVAALAVPPLYADVSLTTFRLHGDAEARGRQQRVQAHGLRYLAEWPEVHHRLLVLRGEPGTGKGHWSWSVSKEIAQQGYMVRVVKLANLIRELRRGWRSSSAASEEETLAAYRSLDLLVIDEVSRHAFYGENIHQHLYDVLDDRIEQCRATILTTNETAEGIESILRPALWSRLHGNGAVLEFGSDDYRQLEGAA